MIKTFLTMLFFVGHLFAIPAVHAQQPVDVWWPTNGVSVNGVQPFKALLSNYQLSQYQMFWQVDNGQLNSMQDSYTDWPHKEASVDLTNWNWHGTGPYTINFLAKDSSGNILGSTSVTIYTGTAQVTASPTPTPTPTPVTISAPVSAGSSFYIDPQSNAEKQYVLWQYTRPADAMNMLKIATQPQAKWFGGWNTDIYSDVNSYVSAAFAKNTTPILVAYNIPGRDCGGYSQGGANTPDAYKSWINAVASGINHRRALVIVEPDGLANLDCLSSSDQQTRYALISYAITTLKNSGATVYADAGNPNWISAPVMATRLQKAGVGNANGFSLNISNFYTTASNIAFGTTISQLVGNKHFVIDTGRNGLGPTGDFQWCNPSGRALGNRPTTATGNPLVDAFLWIKDPGESDGQCNGGPAAGVWWPDYALGLAQRAAY